MAKRTNISILRLTAIQELDNLEKRFGEFEKTFLDSQYYLLRWVSSMAIVELHSIWERYAENRLIYSLNNHPTVFIEKNGIKGISAIPKGLSCIIVRGSGKYFDFRSVDDLIKKGNNLLEANNPFRSLKRTHERNYLDTISSIRNYVVHKSRSSQKTYKDSLKASFSVKSVPDPDEFLNAKDNRKNSPLKGKKRINVLISIVKSAVKMC